ADALLPVATLGEVILAEVEGDAARLHLDPDQLARFLVLLSFSQSESVAVPADGTLQIVHGDAGETGAEAQGLGLPTGGMLRSLRLGGGPFLRGGPLPFRRFLGSHSCILSLGISGGL